MDYKVIVSVPHRARLSDSFLDLFEKEVNKHIDLGYEPVGGISSTGHAFFCQAMQKSSKTKMTRVGGRKKASVKRTKKKPIY